MSTLLTTRASRALMFAVAALFTLSLLAPLAVFASTDLVSGDQAVISNPNGSGANLRNDNTVLDDSTLITELPQDTIVTISDGPYVNENGVWFWVIASPVEGWVEASLLRKVDSQPATDPAEAAPEAPVETPVVGLPWLEPIDSAVVVDDNAELPVDGLAIRVSATVDGDIIGRVPVGTALDVTEQRIWDGEQSFVRVNFNGQGGYVNGSFVELTSELEAAAPVVEEAPVEELPADDVAPVEEAPVEVPVEEAPVEVVPAEEAPVVEEPVTEDVPVEAPAEVVPTEEAPVENAAPVEDVVPTESAPVAEAPTAAPVIDEATEEVVEPTAEPVVESTPVAEEPVADAPAADVAGEEVAVVDSTPIAEAPVVDAPTEGLVESTPVAADPTEDVVEPTAEPVVEDATEEAPQATAEATVEAPAAPASSTPAFDADSMIGSATVTGTLDGLRCRVAPDGSAATLMVLPEGTKVLVFAEAVNGYLGIDCGGVQGYADVAYLWSGGAGDGEIQKSNMSVVVTGTGNGLNCRTGAGTGSPVITVLRDGTALTTRGAATNGWVPVVCGGQNGFVATTWVEVKAGTGSTGNTGSTPATGTATVVNTNGDGLYCRSGAGSSYSVITVLSPGQSVPVRGASQGSWTPVTCGGAAGWASNQYLSVSGGTAAPAPSKPAPTTPAPATGTVTVANTGGQGLNCRSGAGTSHGVITVLSLGQSVSTRSGSTGGWTAVLCGGKNGFVSSEFVTGGGSAPAPTTPAPTPAPQPSGMKNGDHAQSTAHVNLRYSASLGSGVATVVPTGTVVLVTGGASSGFYPVNYDGLSGFMSADYLVKTNAALTKRGGSASPSPSQPAPAPGGTATGNALVNYAMNYVGYPYVWATHGPSSFDCSGFTYWVVQNVMGKNIGYGTWTQVSAGTPVSRSNLQPGDLVFFQNTYTAGLSHVGLYIGGNQFVHAQNEDTGVVVSSLDSSYYSSRWYGAVRL